MKSLLIITLIFLTLSCTTIAGNIGKKLPRKLEDAKVYQINDSTWNDILKKHNSKVEALISNSLILDITYSYLQKQINQIIKEDDKFINFFHDETVQNEDSANVRKILKKDDKNILILSQPIITKSTDNQSISLTINYFMKKQLFDVGFVSLPIEKSGRLIFSFAPEIKGKVISLNTTFEKSEGGLLDTFGGFAFRGFINLFLKGLNEFKIPDEYLQSERITLLNSSVKMGFDIFDLDATIQTIDSEKIKYKISSDFSLFFNDSGKIEIDSVFHPTLILDVNVIQSAINEIMKERNQKLFIKGDSTTNDFFYFDSIAVVGLNDKIELHTRYKGKIPLTVFDYGINGELDMVVHPLILNNKMYLKFEKFIFYGEQKDTDLLSNLLNVLISESIKKTLSIDLNDYIPSYEEVLDVNENVEIKHVQAVFTKGMVRNGKIYIFSKLSAVITFN